MHVCLRPLGFFAINSKNLQCNPFLKFVTLPNILLRMPLCKQNLKKKVLPLLTALLEHPVQKKFFALIKKIFLQNLVEIIFTYQISFFKSFWTPWDPLKTKWEFLHMRCRYHNRLKRVRAVHFWRNFWKIF